MTDVAGAIESVRQVADDAIFHMAALSGVRFERVMDGGGRRADVELRGVVLARGLDPGLAADVVDALNAAIAPVITRAIEKRRAEASREIQRVLDRAAVPTEPWSPRFPIVAALCGAPAERRAS